MKLLGAAAALAALLIGGAQGASAQQRFPVIGCFSFQLDDGVVKYAPNGRCSLHRPGEAGVVGGDVGIIHMHWRYWGHGKAYGKGHFYDGLGFLHPATATVYRLLPPTNQYICSLGGTAYSRMRITWKPVEAGGARRPGGTHIFNVTPLSEAC